MPKILKGEGEEKLKKEAFFFACHYHYGQKRNGGENYIIHPVRVSERVGTDKQKICALLHDVVEDTDATLEDIRKIFGEEVRDTVDCLTHRQGESYDDYITRVLTDADAVKVKIADICDNLNDSPSKNAIEKSLRALPRLLTFPTP